ncbi:MAG TPA: hypothetical protein HPP79_10390 [Gammaproteobacteria bacterium]|jgi:hypothetical protein|nr:hypothetical protein [Gammaproteobacteria bacterium]HIJ29436.1 hypothetical protein [Gammaproteobacteria bacterium]HIJ49312.1 hypothetical protein [Gammaproteobacteria bacterium]
MTATVNKAKTARAATTRNSETRSNKPWAPPSMLDAPEPPPGFHYRWIRESAAGQLDSTNMSKRMREGYEPVRAEDHPEFASPTVQDGQHAGVIGVGGLILAKIPDETVGQRNEYYRAQTDGQMDAVDNNLMRESDSSMPMGAPNRKSTTSFGSR